MKRLILTVLVLLSLSSAAFAQEPPVATDTPQMPEYTWEQIVQLTPAQASNFVQIAKDNKADFVNAWALIDGRVLVNGCETTMVSWCNDSTVNVVAIGVASITIRGN